MLYKGIKIILLLVMYVVDCVGPFGMQGKIALSILFAAAWSSILQGS